MNKVTHALSVPLRKTKYRRQVLIGGVAHAYRSRWKAGVARTWCGIGYTHNKTLTGKTYATRTTREVDCMACVAARCE